MSEILVKRGRERTYIAMEAVKSIDWNRFREKKLTKLRSFMKDANLDALLLGGLDNVRYATDNWVSWSVWILRGTATFLTKDAGPVLFCGWGSVPRIKIYMPWIEDVRVLGTERHRTFEKVFEDYGVKKGRIGLDFMLFQDYLNLTKVAPGIDFVDVGYQISETRSVKLPEEIRLLRDSAQVCELSILAALNEIRQGVREYEVTAAAEYAARMAGADAYSWPLASFSGVNTAPAFTRYPSDKRIRYGDLVILGYGLIYQGYNTDITVTTIVGKPAKKQKEIYRATYDAEQEAIKAIKPGIDTRELHKIALSVIKEAGYKKYSYEPYHALGHGVGLNVYEPPFFPAPGRDVPNAILKPGHVFAIEPAVVIHDELGVGGVRIGDTVLVTENGCEVLTKVVPQTHEELMSI